MKPEKMRAATCATSDRDHNPSAKPVCCRVSDQLLDMMAADDVSRNAAALEKLKEKRKIACAEKYLRAKFR